MDKRIRLNTVDVILWSISIALIGAIAVGYFLRLFGYWKGF